MTNFVITLKWILLVITLARVNADDTHGIEKRDTNGEAKKVVCYYTNWSVYRQGTAKFTPLNINPYLCTHLIYAFGGLDKENDGLRPFDSYQDIEQGGYTKFTGLKNYNKNLKTMIAIGGWNEGSSRFSKLVADEDRRSTFVKNVIKFLRQNNFDGLDLDWEYPAFRDGGKAADRENYAALVKELREEFERESSKTGRPRLLLTMAVPAGIEYIDKGYDVPKLNKYLDFMNILSYDYYSVYEPKVNHHAPLYTLREPTEYDYDSQLSIDQTIKHYLKNGAEQEKLVVGIPTYGRSFTLLNPEANDVNSQAEGPGKKGEATKEKGYLAYYEICTSVTKDGWTVVHPNKSAMGPYAYNENQWVGYDDMDSVKLKSKYVNDKNLGGIMFWAIDIDDFRGKCHGKPYPLIEAGKEALYSGNSGKVSNSVTASTDKKRTKLSTRKDRPKELSLTSVKHRSTTTTESPTDSVPAEDVAGRQSTESDAKKLVCYHTNWSAGRSGTGKFTPETLNPHLCTHLVYAFAAPDIENNTIVPTDEAEDLERGGYAKFTRLKNKNKNLKTLLAIGGWNEGSARFSKLVASKSKRTAFARNAVKFLRQNNFDGLDINWQYPTFRNGNADDKENFVSLIKEIKDEFVKDSTKTGKSRLLLTISVPAGINYINNGFDVAKLNKYLDFMNVLAYDYHSGSDPNVYHHSPLYSLPDQSLYESELTINYTIYYLMKNGADPGKLVLGIPTYGRSYTLLESDNTELGSAANGRGQSGKYTKENGYLAYYEICANLASGEWTVVHPNKSAMGPYAYRENQWIGYDDEESVKLKANYAVSKGLGGIMFWAADIDDFKGECHNKPYPLIEAGKEILLDNNKNTADQENIISAESSRPKKSSTTTTPSSYTLSTPEPPTTPDTGADFTCEEDGFFPHPRDCKKYFWCLDSGPSNLGIVAHQFTCPAGLMFNKATDSCDYSRNVVCSKKTTEKTTTTTTTTPKSKTTTAGSRYSSTTTSTTTTTTTEAPAEEEEEEEEGENVEEDPKAIKQLITLIKKLGGINELERQLKLDDGSKEVTTPAISKNLYNKVFSNPNSNRFRTQHRNAPSGPQNEGLSTTDDVPYRKDKPQYVTIQRSRPQKSFVADAEDSGTTNNKAVRPNKETTEYTDSVEEDDVTTTKYSSPRSRTTQKYVVLERHRPEKSTTTEEEELIEVEQPSSTTQRYITLVRNRPSTTTNEIEDLITETSTQRATRPAFRTTTTESTTISDKPKDKVSEIATTTAETLSVTSAQYITTSQVQSSGAVSDYTTTSEPTTDYSKPYIVFAQTLIDENDSRENSTTVLAANTTEPFLTSTTVISTVRESATEKTRIPLKMYREFVKRNRTDTRHDLATNLVNEPSKTTDVRSTDQAAKTRSTTELRHAFLRGRKLGAATTPLNSVNQTDSLSAEQTSTHSRFAAARRKLHLNVTASPEEESTSHEENATTTHRYNRHRSTSAESQANIDNFFKRRRASSTTSQKPDDSPLSSTSNPFTRGSSRYFSKSKNKSNNDTSTESLSTTHKSRFSKDKFRDHRKKSESSESQSSASQETATPPPDQLSQSNSNEEEIDAERTEKPDPSRRSTVKAALSHVSGVETTTRKYAYAEHFRQRNNHHTNSTTPVIATHSNTTAESSTSRLAVADHFRHWARTTTATVNSSRDVSASTTHRPSAVDHFRHNNHQTQTTIDEDKTQLEAENTRNVEQTYIPRSSTTSRTAESIPVSETYSRINPRNNSRFLKNPEPAYRFQEHKQKVDPFRIHVTLSPPSPKPSDSPLFLIQRTNETGFEVQIRHGNDGVAAARSREKSAPTVALQRGRKKFSNNRLEEGGNTAAHVVADQQANAGLLEARRSRTQYSSPATAIRSYVGETSTRKATTLPSRNRGSVKAQNSLSKAEIKELVNLADTPSSKSQSASRQQRPINKIEETYYEVTPKFTPRHRVESAFVPLTHTDNFGYSKLYTLPDELNDRYDPEPSFNYYFFNNALQTEPSEVLDPTLRDSLKVSETQNLNEGARQLFAAREKSASPDKPSTQATAASSSESSSRIRGNFRRTNSSQSRSRSTTSTTTSTEYTPTESSNKLSSRFRRRKGRPENRSINTARDENFIPLAEVESSTVTRHKNYDISHRGTALVSDYLPVPAPLYRVNQTSNSDQLNGANLNLEDLDAQIIIPPTHNKNYDSDDVSDLANPAVAAITNLKTMPPASTYTKMMTARPSTIVTYPSEPKIEYHSSVATVRTTALPIYVPTISPRRGSTKISGRTTTTTQIPSLQDIYNDYQEDLEYHAEPVEIPITGKVRIHSDGYIECLDMGNFPHPFSCRKFISCAKMEYDTLLGWEYTCPKGLSFDPIGGICNWSAGLGCKE